MARSEHEKGFWQQARLIHDVGKKGEGMSELNCRICDHCSSWRAMAIPTGIIVTWLRLNVHHSE